MAFNVFTATIEESSSPPPSTVASDSIGGVGVEVVFPLPAASGRIGRTTGGVGVGETCVPFNLVRTASRKSMLLRVDQNTDPYLVEDCGGPLGDVDVPVGDRVERAGIYGPNGAFHGSFLLDGACRSAFIRGAEERQ